MRHVYRWLNISPKGCGMYPHLDPSVPTAHGRGYGYTNEGVGYDNRADTPEDSAGAGGVDGSGDGGLSEDGDGWGQLQAFVSNVSAGETDAIVQRLTP